MNWMRVAMAWLHVVGRGLAVVGEADGQTKDKLWCFTWSGLFSFFVASYFKEAYSLSSH